MSARTQDLPPLRGCKHIIRELRYHEASRQVLAFVLIAWFAFISKPLWLSSLIGSPLILIGTLLRLYASGFIIKNKKLATHGPYALVRHPLYTGNILIISGFYIYSSISWTLALTAFFFWFYYPTAIEYEDRKLRTVFGAQWEQWSRKVPKLIPTFSNLEAVVTGEWSFAKSAHRNGEPLIVFFIIVCFSYMTWKIP